MDRILLSHGGGGRQTQKLVRELFAKHFANSTLDQFGDAALLNLQEMGDERRETSLAFTTDSYVVRPIEFPGGNIGKLAVCGTVNDLAVSGAKPLWLSCGFIIEEGFEVEKLERIVASMAKTAREADVSIVCGDTKVVDRGTADGLFINTAGVGKRISRNILSPDTIQSGDKILLSGTIADHGIAIMASRKELTLVTPIESDCAALNELTAAILESAPNTRCMRDPTRGGVAAALNEWIENSDKGIAIEEETIPLNESTRAVCEMLGFDPLTVANEGKLVAVVPAEESAAALSALKAHPLGKDASIIGDVTTDKPGKLVMNTIFGTTRIVPLPFGELLPRIC
jgi:hydrogenase expression/formation protein HypE